MKKIILNFLLVFLTRNDLEFYATSPKTEVNIAKQRETEEMFQKQKQEFEKLRSDVQIKLKFLDENRVSSFQNAEIRRIYKENNESGSIVFGWL